MYVEREAVYQRSLLGGIGGALGWIFMSIFASPSTETTLKIFINDAITGAAVGLAIGACSGAWDGLFRDRTRQRLINGIALGGSLGLVGGALGLMIGEMLFVAAGGGLLWRALGWGLFGAAVGGADGLARRLPQKAALGAFGGFLGGMFGGSTYESIAMLLQRAGFARLTAVAWGGIIGLVLLGMFIGLFVSFVESVLRAAWLRFLSGRLEGQSRTLDGTRATTIGRGDAAHICLLGDATILPLHARIEPQGGQFTLQADGAVEVDDGTGYRAVRSCALNDGHQIRVGQVRARFHQTR